jgi:predicted dehydrogenase
MYDEIIEKKNIDAVYISLPIGLHEKWIKKAAKAGKHVLCEKSVSTSHKSTKKILDVCKKNEIRVLEGFTFRFHPQHQKICSLLQQKILGEIFSLSIKYGFVRKFSKNDFRFKNELGGGVLNDLGCYIISASKMIFDKNPVKIQCNLLTNSKHKIDTKGSILIEYEKNKMTQGFFGYENYFQSNYELWGEKGIISADWAFNIKKNISAKIRVQKQNKTKQFQLKPTNQFKLMIDSFSKELRYPGCSNINFEEEIFNQSMMMECARLSNKKHKPIYVEDISSKK